MSYFSHCSQEAANGEAFISALGPGDVCSPSWWQGMCGVGNHTITPWLTTKWSSGAQLAFSFSLISWTLAHGMMALLTFRAVLQLILSDTSSTTYPKTCLTILAVS